MKSVLISFFYSDNLGDIIIANTLYDYMNEICLTDKISYGSDPFKYSDLNNMYITRKESKKQLFKNHIFRAIVNLHLENVLESYRKSHKREAEIKLEKKIIESDIVVIGGGNMIFDVSKYSRSAKPFKRIIDVATEYNKKVFAISIGIGPFVTREQEKQAVEALNRCDFITFRDEKSLEIYKKYYSDKKAFLAIDPVFMLPQYIKPEHDKDEKVIGINLFDNRLAKENQRKYTEVKKGYIKLINALAKQKRLKLFLFSTDMNDYDLINEVYKEIPSSNLEIRSVSGLNDLIKLYNEVNLLIGCRMHSMIIAYTQHIPIIGLSWQPKVDAFFDIINQAEDVFRYDDIEDNLNRILNCCDSKLNNLKKEKEKIQTQLEEIRKNFKKNEEILRNLIKYI